jgi:hypothetical protein
MIIFKIFEELLCFPVFKTGFCLSIDACVPIDAVIDKWGHPKAAFAAPGFCPFTELYTAIIDGGPPTGIA